MGRLRHKAIVRITSNMHSIRLLFVCTPYSTPGIYPVSFTHKINLTVYTVMYKKSKSKSLLHYGGTKAKAHTLCARAGRGQPDDPRSAVFSSAVRGRRGGSGPAGPRAFCILSAWAGHRNIRNHHMQPYSVARCAALLGNRIARVA